MNAACAILPLAVIAFFTRDDGLSHGLVSPIDAPNEFQSATAEFEQGQRLLAGQPDRARELFRSSAQRFARLLQSGIRSGPLEYNAGNAFLQAGDVGRAILHYRRAQRLRPRDEMRADNLGEAKRRCITNLAPKRSDAVLRSLFFWHHETSTRERLTAAVILYVGFWLCLTVRGLVPRRGFKLAAVICALATLTLGSSLLAERWADRTQPAGVMIETDVAVYKGPGTGYQRQFEQPLQPGVEFRRREQRAGWWNIVLPDGQSGWIDASTAELVPV